jgi:hypothetical protein
MDLLFSRTRFNGQHILPTPTFSQLSTSAQNHVRFKTQLDDVLYQHALAHWRETMRLESSPAFVRDLNRLRKLQTALTDACETDPLNRLCQFYRMTDSEVVSLLSHSY